MRIRFLTHALLLTVLLVLVGTSHGAIQNASGRLTMLRVQDVGTKFGPPADQIDVEVVIRLDNRPGEAFGFTLRNDANALTHQAMLDLLRDAFANNWLVTIDYSIDPGKKNGIIIRTWLKR